MKIVTILGARPQFIKAGTVSRAIMEHNESLVDGFSFLEKEEQARLETKNHKLITELIVHTGQHFDANMSDIFFDEMKIPKPDYNLDINGLGHGAMTGQMLEKIEEVLLKEKPDWVMVYGDTNSTIAGALAASKLHIKVAHVEAGLRSFNMKMPEEVNRILTDRISDILFCPTDAAVKNLENEGYSIEREGGRERKEGIFGKVVKVGDVMQDGALFYKDLAQKPSTFHLPPSTFILCTIHRAENTDDPQRLKAIFEALNEIAQETPIVLPLHPRTKQKLKTINQKPKTKNLIFIDPVGYLNMVWLIDNCKLVMTDSGGLQKEAFFFEKPCITLRDETEWVELVDNGFNTLVGADKEKIVSSYKSLVSATSNQKPKTMNYKLNLYGGGKASETIVRELLEY
jgi:UDP-GlcNAc3NAcA epimerase